MERFILTLFSSALFCTQAVAESSVWKAQKDGSVIYLGGTFHLLRPSDLPLPPEFDAAYKMADMLVFETDLAELQAPETQQKLMAKSMYTDGSTVDQHLSAETYDLLVQYGAENDFPVTAFKSFKPSMIAVTLTTMELMKAGITEEGVDLRFYNRAVQDEKPVEILETIDEQISYITGMGKGNEDTLIAHTISDIKKIKRFFEDLIAAWKNGDTNKLNTLINEELKKTPKLYKELLVDRNRKWMPKIEAYQKSPEKELILVGTAHLIGPDGLLEALRNKGFLIETVQAAPIE